MITLRRRYMGNDKGITPIAYIQSTNTQWIDTGIDALDVYGWEVNFMRPVAGNEGNVLYANGFSATLYSNGGFNTVVHGVNNGYTGNGLNQAMVEYTLFSNDDMTTLYAGKVGNGGVSKNYTAPVGTSSGNIFLFRNGNSVSPLIITKVVFKDANNQPIFHAIPVKTRFGEGCMYDLVSRRLLRNMGSGAFILGPDVLGGV